MSRYFGLVRVSTKTQNLERQYKALAEYAKENKIEYTHIYQDKISGNSPYRMGYNSLKQEVISGDTIIVKELDRLGTSYEKIIEELHFFSEKNVDVVFVDLPMPKIEDQTTSKLIEAVTIRLLSYVADKEREKIRQRVKEGIEVAREKGVKLGRPSTELPKSFFKYYEKWKKGEITGTAFANIMTVSRPTMYRYIAKYEKERKVAS